jgi:hypothetical protein
MTGVLRAEIALLLRRRGTRVVGWTALVLVVAFAVLRFVTSTADTGPAVQRATETATMLAAQTGTPLDLGAAYQEPRYVFAAQYPYDAAGAVVGLVLIALIGGAVLAGGDWRTRAVGLTFPDWRRRSGPVVRRILAWAVVAGGITLAALSALTALLLATAALRGSTVGVDVLTVVLLVGRGAVLGGLGGLIGAALASILRSDLLVVIGVLGYVLVVETLVPALLQNGWRTPGNRLIDLAIAADPGRAPHLACDVPRCADAVAAGAGPLVPQLLLVGVAAVLVLVAHRAARRAIWT